MRAFQTFALCSATIAVITASCALLNGQDSSPGAKSDLIAVSIAMKQDRVTPGQEALVILTAKNISKQNLFPRLAYSWVLHVEGEKGEPPLTYYHRQRRREPGLPPLDGGGPPPHPINVPGEEPYEGVPPGSVDVLYLDLKVYYDLIPGQYSVYLEVQDKAGVSLRTNTVHFEILPPAQ